MQVLDFYVSTKRTLDIYAHRHQQRTGHDNLTELPEQFRHLLLRHIRGQVRDMDISSDMLFAGINE